MVSFVYFSSKNKVRGAQKKKKQRKKKHKKKNPYRGRISFLEPLADRQG